MNINTARPLIMHVDLNSCFATIEQQSRPLLRHRPVAVLNRNTEHTAIVTASYEAKRCGVKVGMKFRDARLLCPGIVGLESDPPKYRYVYRRLMAILNDYSAHVQMKSIDEGVIDFSHSTKEHQQADLREVGLDIKQRLKKEVGNYMSCNIGIGPNRFLAKTAAGLHKPDGLDVIDSSNIRQVYSELKLEDLTGIADGYSRRLRQVGITTPLEFFDASAEVLERSVFRSVCGIHWYRRLRGWEVDDNVSELKSVGRQHVLAEANLSHEAVLAHLHSLCEDVALKLRNQVVRARGVRVYAKTHHKGMWQSRKLVSRAIHDEESIYETAKALFKEAPLPCYEIGITCYNLTSESDFQMSLFLEEDLKKEALVSAIDTINNDWGARTIHSADTLQVGQKMKQKIPFGSVRYL